MGYIRPYKVKDDVTESQASYTIDIDLPKKGRFSYCNLIVKMQTATTGVAPDPWIRNLITSVSINQGGQSHLNGATVDMFQADAYYKGHGMGTRGYNVMGPAGENILESIPIHFGESMHDPSFGIDLAKLNDPQISVTYNTANTSAMGEVLWDPAYYPQFTPILYLQEGTWPALQGYQSLRQMEKYTPVDAEKHKTELKGGRPIKRVFAQLDLKAPAYGWIHSINNLRLIGDNDEWKPFDQDVDLWYQCIRDSYGLANLQAYVWYVKGGKHFDCGVDKRVVSHMQAQSGTSLHIPHGGSGRNVPANERLIADGTAPSNVISSMYDFHGYTPWTVGVIDSEKMLGVEWLEWAEKAPVYVELEHVSNAATIGGPVRIAVSDKAHQ